MVMPGRVGREFLAREAVLVGRVAGLLVVRPQPVAGPGPQAAQHVAGPGRPVPTPPLGRSALRVVRTRQQIALPLVHRRLRSACQAPSPPRPPAPPPVPARPP